MDEKRHRSDFQSDVLMNLSGFLSNPQAKGFSNFVINTLHFINKFSSKKVSPIISSSTNNVSLSFTFVLIHFTERTYSTIFDGMSLIHVFDFVKMFINYESADNGMQP